MKQLVVAAVSALLLLAGGALESAQCGHRIGGGLHYLRTLGQIKDSPDWDKNAVGFMVSYQYAPGFLKVEADLEWIPNWGFGDKTMFQPQAWLLVGGLIYGSAGIGFGYYDGDWMDNPFYGIRAGVDLGSGGLDLDLFASYRFLTSKVLDTIDEDDLDSLTFGAILRFGD